MSRDEAEALIAAIPGIEPAICNDTRFNHVDAFYKQLFKLHSCEALVSIVKGLRCRMTDKKIHRRKMYIINCIAQAKAES